MVGLVLTRSAGRHGGADCANARWLGDNLKMRILALGIVQTGERPWVLIVRTRVRFSRAGLYQEGSTD